MTPAAICGLTGCGQCRSIHQCRRRCGVAAEPRVESPAPRHRATPAEIGWFTVAATFFVAVSLSALALAEWLP